MTMEKNARKSEGNLSITTRMEDRRGRFGGLSLRQAGPFRARVAHWRRRDAAGGDEPGALSQPTPWRRGLACDRGPERGLAEDPSLSRGQARRRFAAAHANDVQQRR